MPSRTFVMWMRGSEELALEVCKSRENCTRKRLTNLGDKPLVRAIEADSVLTSSSPLLLSVELVIGLAGSKNTLFFP
jgi:hypothetical protein